MKRALVTFAAVALAFAATASQALAFDCVVASKPVGAGSAVTVTFPDQGPPSFTPNKPNAGTEEQLHGGFATASGTLPDGTVVSTPVDTFVHAPEKADGVIPGATVQESKGKGCDGKGLDTIDACN